MKKLVPRLKKYLPILVYMLAVIIWFLVGLVNFVADDAMTQQELQAQTAQLVNLQQNENGLYVSQNSDPQLIFSGIDMPLRVVSLSASFSLPQGEMELFYTRQAGEDFSLQRRVIGVPQEGGGYMFYLPRGSVHSLRIDLGTTGGNEVQIYNIALNPALSAAHYLVPSLREVLFVLIVPALALCAIYTIMEILQNVRDGRKKTAHLNADKEMA